MAAKKNKTCFDVGNKAAEKWTIKEAELVFEKAIEMSERNDCYFIGSIAKDLKISRHTFAYLCRKFSVLTTKKEIIDSNIENNLFIGGLTDDDVNSTVSIFGLKNNHGWKDKTEIEQTVTQTNIIDLGKGIKPEDD